jgi:hypothetical protein
MQRRDLAITRQRGKSDRHWLQTVRTAPRRLAVDDSSEIGDPADNPAVSGRNSRPDAASLTASVLLSLRLVCAAYQSAESR